MGIGPIPWTDIIKYAHWYGFHRDTTEAFVDIIREMDRAFIDYQIKEQKKRTAKPPKSNQANQR